MNKLVLVAFFYPFISEAQGFTIPINTEGKVQYTKIVTVDSQSADALYSKAQLFIAQTAYASKNIVQLTDNATKTIVVKGTIEIFLKEPLRGLNSQGFSRMRITISCKDNKYKYDIGEITFQPTQQRGSNYPEVPIENEKMYFPYTVKYFKRIKEETDILIRSYISELETAMINKSDNW